MAGYNLKSPEEVKEYLKNLHIEYKFGCLSEKNPETCHLLGDYEESISKDYEKSAKIYKENCDERNFAHSCRKFGGYALIGKGLDAESPTESYKYLKKGCDVGDMMSCAHAGIVATSSFKIGEKEVPIDFPTGLDLLHKTCHEHKLEKACYYLSGLYLGGVPDYLEKNMKEAYKASIKACELGNAYACANLSQMHARGDGVQKNSELAEAFKQRALSIQRALQETKHIPFQQGMGS
ncbi:cytochrome c oxidase assembly factor 7 homolog [Neodiprion pinetum]|uniref:cytochrome c oxidase assembly factor 7 homolog n=1 Tax=Neodiprion pinetum TaxID=441929 RepID=UPI001EE0C584|nr:cytochrome c oxidase assembly factor 7 homolog [Neodiprion pinetum]